MKSKVLVVVAAIAVVGMFAVEVDAQCRGCRIFGRTVNRSFVGPRFSRQVSVSSNYGSAGGQAAYYGNGSAGGTSYGNGSAGGVSYGVPVQATETRYGVQQPAANETKAFKDLSTEVQRLQDDVADLKELKGEIVALRDDLTALLRQRQYADRRTRPFGTLNDKLASN